jgi:hypothetical protein
MFSAHFPFRYLSLAKWLAPVRSAHAAPLQAADSTPKNTTSSDANPQSIDRSNLTKTQVEEWLDWLENHGGDPRDSSWEQAKGFALQPKQK